MKKLFAMLLALCLVLGIAAAANADVPADWAPFAERVKITVPVYDRSKAGYPAVDDNYWTKWVQSEFGDKYNIDVQYVAIPRGDVMTKYSLLIAADETPTILMEYDYPKVAQWANDGAMAVISLDDFKAVAPTFYQAMVDHNQLGYTDINGETYFVLTERPYYDTTFAFATFVRMDWLRQVGYDHVPQNYAEYKDAINKMIEAGITKYPLSTGIPSAAYIANFAFRDFPVTDEGEKEWAMHSSLGTPCFPWYPTQRMLKRLNDEYHMGWFAFELMIHGRCIDEHGIFYPDGTIRDAGTIAAMFGCYRNRDSRTVVPTNPNREGKATHALNLLRDALTEYTSDAFDYRRSDKKKLLDACEVAANLLEACELVPMSELPTTKIEEFRRDENADLWEIRKFAYALAQRLKEVSQTF